MDGDIRIRDPSVFLPNANLISCRCWSGRIGEWEVTISMKKKTFAVEHQFVAVFFSSPHKRSYYVIFADWSIMIAIVTMMRFLKVDDDIP